MSTSVKFIKQNRTLFLLFCITLLGTFIRLYRIDTLSIFIADQAVMSTEVLKILRGNLTLLGPKASIGPFFFGPIVYYLLAPFYFFSNGYPLAGTIFETALQILTIPLVFLIGKKVKNEQVGLIAAFCFAVSALLVEYSRATFNTTTALFFSTLVIYLFFSILSK
jgi:4-amino-4-deoxy-L-arabinose transferase-like glycosyltransferase